MGTLTFRTIDLNAHASVCLRFRDDDIRDGGGTLSPDRTDHQYLAWLRARIAAEPRFAVHAWKGDAIVGEVVLDWYRHDRSAGWVNRYYLVPGERAPAVAAELDAYAAGVFAQLGMQRAYLAAFPSSKQALRFYQSIGWVDLGPPSWAPRIHLLERRY